MASSGDVGAGHPPLGVILAGGRGRRIGGGKAAIALRGQPLISYPLRAMREALEDVVVLAKPDTTLPPLPGVRLWIEPTTPRHPLFGIVHALELSEGRAIVVCPVDLPFVSAELVNRLVTEGEGRPATVAAAEGRIQPLLARYEPSVSAFLARVLKDSATVSVLEAVRALRPELVEVPPAVLDNVNAPEDLLRAAARLDQT